MVVFSKSYIDNLLNQDIITTEDFLKTDDKGNTVLIYAVFFSHKYENDVKLLLEKGATHIIDTQNKKGFTPLMYASLFTDYTSVVGYNPDVDYASTENTVNMLIDAGANLDLQNNDGFTALMLASSYTNYAYINNSNHSNPDIDYASTENTVKILIDAGANLNIQDKFGNTALTYAVSYSNTSPPENLDFKLNYASTENTVKMLIDAGANLDIQNNTIGVTALMYAVEITNETSTENTIKMLIDAGANLNLQNNLGDTALMISAELTNKSSTENTVKMLIDAGADLNIQDENGETALIRVTDMTNRSSTEKTLKMLIDAGANLDIQNKYGETALMLASKYSKDTSTENTVKMLIDTGADVTIKTKRGKTALDYAKTDNVRNMLIQAIENQTNIDYPRIGINITKTVSFEDPIMLVNENINIANYIKESPDNIVIVYNLNDYFFTKRSIIMKQLKEATLFPCKEPDTMRPDNIIMIPLFNLTKIGFNFTNPMCNINIFLENKKGQLFNIINVNKKYPSFVSLSVIQGGNVVSAAHCQSGQENGLSLMIDAYPSIEDNTTQMVGGQINKKHNNTRKNKKKYNRKHNNTRKNKKMKNKKMKNKNSKKHNNTRKNKKMKNKNSKKHNNTRKNKKMKK
jgi:ankyrin repeat protein